MVSYSQYCDCKVSKLIGTEPIRDETEYVKFSYKQIYFTHQEDFTIRWKAFRFNNIKRLTGPTIPKIEGVNIS